MIVEVTRGMIRLAVGGREVQLEGELLNRSPDGPDFVVFSGMLKKWSDATPITDADRRQILDDLRVSARTKGLRIEIE